MMDLDTELDGWRRHWQSQSAVPADLVKRVESGTRSLRRGLIAEIIMTIVLGGGSLVWALVSSRAEFVVLTLAIWVLLAIAWTASVLLRRGSWEPATFTTAAFLDISILRCERSLRAITIQVIMYVVILVFDLVWLYHYLAQTSVREFLLRPMVLVFLLIVTPAAAATALWHRQRLQRELQNLTHLREQT